MALRPRKIPELSATELWLLRVILEWTDMKQGRPQDIYLPRKRKVFDRLRKNGSLEPTEYGENEDCATEVTKRGRRAMDEAIDRIDDAR